MFEDFEGSQIQADALNDLADEAFEVCGYSKETIENERGRFVVSYRDNIWCYFCDEKLLFIIEKTVNSFGEVIFSVEFV